MNPVFRTAAAVFVMLAMPVLGVSQNSATGKKPIAFSGRVESIDLTMRTVAVRHGSIPGFMPAMTLDYMVDDDAILNELSPSDEITATVYTGDPVLHNIHVTGRGRSGNNR